MPLPHVSPTQRACPTERTLRPPPTSRTFNEAGRQTSSSHHQSHRSRLTPPFGRHIAAKPVRPGARPAELARRNNNRHNRSAGVRHATHAAHAARHAHATHAAWHAAPRLPHNRSSRGGQHTNGGIGANCTAGARGARAGSAWAADGWDGGGESSRPLRAEEVRLVLSSSVAHYESALYVDAVLTNWMAWTRPGEG